MKKSTLIIVILLLIATIVILLQVKTPEKVEAINTSQQTEEGTKEEKQQDILKMRQQIEKETAERLKKEQEEKAERERLERLQKPELITSNLREVGTLITYEGEVTYRDNIVQKGFLSKRELSVTIQFKFGVGIDLNKISVGDIVKDSVTIIIPKEAIQVEYLKILPKETTIDGNKSLLAKQFKPEEIEFIYETAQSTSLSRINNTPEIFDRAYESLENNLRKLVTDLGYKKVLFQEMTNWN